MDDARASAHLQRIVAEARIARPEISFDEGEFAEFLSLRPARLEAGTVVHAGDLLLAFACARGDTTALELLERTYLARLPMLLPARQRNDAEEVVQVLRDRLLVSVDKSTPRIEEYTGRGGMQNWLRVAAVRVALNLKRSRRREVEFDEDSVLAERTIGDLELDHLKRRYRAEFRAAFSAALARLEVRDRNLLRQHYLDGLTMEAIAALYSVHRTTVFRWVEGARTAMSRETQRELGLRLRVDRHELESILRLIDSQIDASFRAFLGEPGEAGDPGERKR